MTVPARKRGVFVDTKGKLAALSRNRDVFMAGKMVNIKRHPWKNVPVTRTP